MTILKQISEAIWRLGALRCERKDMIIAFSPLIERYIEEEIMSFGFYPFNLSNGKLYTYEGIKIYNLHPYNEIVVYDSVNNCYYPELTIKIEINKPTIHDLPRDNAVNK